VSIVLPDDGLIALVGGRVSPEDLASFAGLLLLFGVFKLVSLILLSVMTTELARMVTPNYRVLVPGLWATAGALALAAFFLLPAVSHSVYAGRYDNAAFLAPWFALAGMLQITESIPLSHMYGRASTSSLNLFIACQVLLVAAGVALAFVLVPRFGIEGLALTALAIFIGRNALGYAFMWLSRAQ
jgi:hypothetical protein